MSEQEPIEFEPVPEPVKKKKARGKKGTKKGSKKASKVEKKEEYKVDKDPETGVMLLPEMHYYRLVIAEQKIKIQERDLRIAKAALKDFQTQVNTQLMGFQSRIKELSQGLEIVKTEYLAEARIVEIATGLSLKDWTIDDDRVLRPIEEKSPSSES